MSLTRRAAVPGGGTSAMMLSGGSFDLPCRPHPTLAQFRRVSPRAEECAALKRQLDPALVRRGGLWDGILRSFKRQIQLDVMQRNLAFACCAILTLVAGLNGR